LPIISVLTPKSKSRKNYLDRKAKKLGIKNDEESQIITEWIETIPDFYQKRFLNE
jgi:hypothetical protein